MSLGVCLPVLPGYVAGGPAQSSWVVAVFCRHELSASFIQVFLAVVFVV